MRTGRYRFSVSVLTLVLIASLFAPQSFARTRKKAAEKPSKSKIREIGSGTFAPIDAMMREATEAKNPPGAVVVIGHNGQIVYRKAFGYRSIEPTREPMTLDTVFDMASLTKCLATATSVMRMIELGQVRLNDPVSKYIPEFAQNGKQDITVRQLLTHYSGLAPDLDLKEQWRGYDTAIQMAMQQTPTNPAGSHFVYSDINYIVLGELVHRVSGMTLDQYASAHIYQPLGMTHTMFNPPASLRHMIEATEYDENNVMLKGTVHDPTARRMGGVAGHAGLFSTADDVAKYAQAMLDGGAPILNTLSVEKMTSPQQPPNMTSVRGVGWDIDTPFASNRGELLPVGSFGHTGFTGTSLWIDPVTQTYVILLTNGVHPRGNQGGAVVALRSKLATAVAAELNLTVSERDKLELSRITGYNESNAAARRIPARNGQVKLGIDVLEAKNFDVLQGKARIGLVTNHTGIDSKGQRTIDVLAHVPGVKLAAIFGPEHGIGGTLDTTQMSNSTDAATGVPIYNLYGGTDEKRRPSLDLMKTLDAVVYDIQDIGVRYYTYPAMLGYFLEAAGKTGTEIIVLDRPDPINGAFVQGAISDVDPNRSKSTEYVDYFPEPIRHGMTIAELAKMFNGERNLGAKLTVVPMEGWMRGDWFDSTGQLWQNLSPNMRSLTEATLYPAIGVFEGTNVAVGRGTDTPFEVVGAPWIDPLQFAQYLNAREIQGVRFVPIYFTPTAEKYKGQRCGGVNVIVLDRNTLDAPELGLEFIAALLKLYPAQYHTTYQPDGVSDDLMALLGNKAVYEALLQGQDPRRISQDIQESVDQFMQMRKKYLIY